MTGMISREFIDLLLSKVDLVDLIQTRVSLRKKSGQNYFACCPFHKEKTASFSVSQQKQFYYCFGCGAHGNAIDFLIQHDHLNFPEAIEALAKQIGMEVPHTEEKIKQSNTSLYDLMEKIANYFYDNMRQSKRAIDYLKKRGISGQMAQQFQVGYASPTWNQILDTFGKTHDEQKNLLAAGLIIKKNEDEYYDRFRDRIMFPIHDHRGRIVGFGGRVIDQSEPKYLNSPETSLFQKGHELYGLYQVLKTHPHLDKVFIVEGYLDVIALFQHQITDVVATLGTATTTQHLQRLFRYTNEIIFCFDGDKAGRTAAWRALQTIFPLMQDHLQIKFLFLPEGEDPDSLIRKIGTNEFEKKIKEAVPLSLFFLQNLSQQNELTSLEGRSRLATTALTYINQLPNGLLQNMMLEELSKRTRIDISHLKQQLSLKHPPLSLGRGISSSTMTKFSPSMRLALALTIQYPQIISGTVDSLPLYELAGYPLLKELFDFIQKHPSITLGSLVEQWRGHENEALIKEFASLNHMIPENGVTKEFLSTIKQLQLLDIDSKINMLLSKASDPGLDPHEKIELSQAILAKKTLAKTLISA